MRKPPCYLRNPCPDRRPGCHGECKEYKEWKSELDTFNENVKAGKEEERKLMQESLDRQRRAKKRRHLK